MGAGKARKLALTAAMRKLLVILNAMLRDGTAWNPDHATATNLYRQSQTPFSDTFFLGVRAQAAISHQRHGQSPIAPAYLIGDGWANW